jgi:predicted secreted protein
VSAPFARAGRGSLLQTSPDGVTFTAIAQLKSFGFDGWKTDTLDNTQIETSGNFKTKIPGRIDGGTVTLTGVKLNSDPGQQSVASLAKNKTVQTWKLTEPDGFTTYTFQGFISEFTPTKVNYSTLITFAAKIAVSGNVTITFAGGFQTPGFQGPGFQKFFTI